MSPQVTMLLDLAGLFQSIDELEETLQGIEIHRFRGLRSRLEAHQERAKILTVQVINSLVKGA